jgi:hypothetical protein
LSAWVMNEICDPRRDKSPPPRSDPLHEAQNL